MNFSKDARARRRFRLAKTGAATVLVATLLGSGCASSRSPATRYPPSHAGVAHRIDQGTVIATRDVVIDGESSNLGMATGGAIGGAAGAVTVGSGGGAQRTVGMAVGGAVGAVVANQVEKKLTEKRAQELTIRLDSGETVVVIYPAEDAGYTEHERVQVFTTGAGSTRVIPHGVDPRYDPDLDAYEIDDIRGEAPPSEPVDWFAKSG